MEAIIGRYYKTEKSALAALHKGEVIITQGKNYIIVSERQAKEFYFEK